MPIPRWILIACLCILLAACAPLTAAPTPPPGLPSTTLTPFGAGLPVTDYIRGQLHLLVISPRTGEPVEGITPIPLGAYSSAFSPDGSHLALVSDTQLYLIDLPAWQTRTVEIDLHGDAHSMAYSPDGTRLALVGGSSGRELQVLDARTGEVQASTQTSFWIDSLQLTADGGALMIYGPQRAEYGVAANVGVSVGDPNAALYSLADLRLLWSVKLPGLRDGTFPKKAEIANTPEIYQPGNAWYVRPGLAFDPRAEVLYLVHGDEERLTTVDFHSRSVKTVDLQLNTSWLERLLSLTVGVAHAKGMDGSSKQAVLSPDGNSLFVIGQSETAVQQADGSLSSSLTSTGLQVINPRDGSLIEKIDSQASWLQLSPDGEQLFLTDWSQNAPSTDVYDVSSRNRVRHLEGLFLVPVRRLDGTYLLASTRTVDGYLNQVTLLDPQTWDTLGGWQKNGEIGWLSSP